MTFKELIAVMFACVLANNYVLSNFMGIESVGSDISKSWKSMAFRGLYVTLAVVASCAITWPLDAYVLVGAAASLRILVFAVVVMAVSAAAGLLFKKDGSSFDLPVMLNSAVLGACLLNVSNGYTFLAGLFSALGVGLGYMLVTFVMAGVMGRINMKNVPKAWRGVPITVAAIAIVSMVLAAF